jgi:hypothetical protein
MKWCEMGWDKIIGGNWKGKSGFLIYLSLQGWIERHIIKVG